MDFKLLVRRMELHRYRWILKSLVLLLKLWKALDQAKAGREHILGEMNKAIKTSRKEFSKHTQKWKK